MSERARGGEREGGREREGEREEEGEGKGGRRERGRGEEGVREKGRREAGREGGRQRKRETGSQTYLDVGDADGLGDSHGSERIVARHHPHFHAPVIAKRRHDSSGFGLDRI